MIILHAVWILSSHTLHIVGNMHAFVTFHARVSGIQSLSVANSWVPGFNFNCMTSWFAIVSAAAEAASPLIAPPLGVGGTLTHNTFYTLEAYICYGVPHMISIFNVTILPGYLCPLKG